VVFVEKNEWVEGLAWGSGAWKFGKVAIA